MKAIVFFFGILAGALIAASFAMQDSKYVLLAIPFVTLVALFWVSHQLAPRIMMNGVARAMREQGELMVDAEATVENLSSTDAQETPWDDPEAMDQAFYTGDRDWFDIEVSITPKLLLSGRPPNWFIGALQLVDYDNNEEQVAGIQLDGVCYVAAIERWVNDGYVPLKEQEDADEGEEPATDEGGERASEKGLEHLQPGLDEAKGSARLKMRIGVATSSRKLKFWYFGQSFGSLELPKA